VTQALCTSFKAQLFQAAHNFSAGGGHMFMLALYTGAVVLDASTTMYSPTGEVVSVGYNAGGFVLTNVNPSVSGTTAMQTFATNPTWTGVTFIASQALLHNASQGGLAIAVFDFGGGQSVVGGTFTINLPPVTPTTALLRLV
jgi:hypothetical protein